MLVKINSANALIVGVLCLFGGIVMVAGGDTGRGVLFCMIGVVGLIMAIVQANAGTADVASAKLQRRRRERFRRKP
jgi:hypothetical protein